MRILAIDDECLALRRLEESIREAAPGAELYSFDSVAKVMAVSTEMVFDVAFLDIHIAGNNGLELARYLKEKNPRINIIFETGYDQYAVEAFSIYASGYILKPITTAKVEAALSSLRYPLRESKPQVKIICFGNFEIFVDGRPMHFTSKKTKELLAYLVNRRGAMVNYRDIIAVLWEDDDHFPYLKKLRKDLMDSCTEYGIAELLLISRGALGFRVSETYCDYEDWMANGEKAKSRYNGEYMTQYSWAEATNADLRARIGK